MRTIRMIVAGLALAIAATGVAAAQAGSKPPAAAKPKPAATHATSGVVKSADATSLVVTSKVAGKDKDTTFVLNATTQKKGDIAVGATVDVRYKTEGTQNIATAVTVHAKKK